MIKQPTFLKLFQVRQDPLKVSRMFYRTNVLPAVQPTVSTEEGNIEKSRQKILTCKPRTSLYEATIGSIASTSPVSPAHLICICSLTIVASTRRFSRRWSTSPCWEYVHSHTSTRSVVNNHHVIGQQSSDQSK